MVCIPPLEARSSSGCFNDYDFCILHLLDEVDTDENGTYSRKYEMRMIHLH